MKLGGGGGGVGGGGVGGGAGGLSPLNSKVEVLKPSGECILFGTKLESVLGSLPIHF